MKLVRMFVFAARAYSSAHLKSDEVLWLRWPNAKAAVRSEFATGADGVAYPVTLYIEMRGEPSLPDQHESEFASAVGSLLPCISLAANAPLHDPRAVHSYYDEFDGERPAIFYESDSANSWWPPSKRWIDLEETERLLYAWGAHGEREMLGRALESYRRALLFNTPETAIMAGNFAWIAAETLSRVIVERTAREAGLTPNGLAKSRRTKIDKLYIEARDAEIFEGDDDLHTALEEASNGFEHGYMELTEVGDLFAQSKDAAFACVRRALIRESLCGHEGTDETALLSADFDEPKMSFEPMHFLRGTMRRKNPAQPVGPEEVHVEVLADGPPEVRRNGDGLMMQRPLTASFRSLPGNVSVMLDGIGGRAPGAVDFGVGDTHVVPAEEARRTALTKHGVWLPPSRD